MNVLMVSAYFWEPPKKYYGIFWMAVNLFRRGHRVVAVSSRIHDSKDREIIEGVHVYRIPALYFSRIPWAIAFPAHLWKLMDYLVDRYKIDIVHLQEIAFPSNLFAAIYCRIRGLPYVATAHGSYFGLGWGFIPDLILDLYVLTAGRFVVRFAEKVSVISKGQIPILLSLGVPKEKIVFTPLGLDTDTSVFKKATEREKKEARKWLHLGENDFVVGFVGRLAPDKNVSLLIDSVNRLSGKIPNLKLLIVGAGVAEELLKRKTAKLRLQNSVSFLGWSICLYPQNKNDDRITTKRNNGFPSQISGYGEDFPFSLSWRGYKYLSRCNN